MTTYKKGILKARTWLELKKNGCPLSLILTKLGLSFEKYKKLSQGKIQFTYTQNITLDQFEKYIIPLLSAPGTGGASHIPVTESEDKSATKCNTTESHLSVTPSCKRQQISNDVDVTQGGVVENEDVIIKQPTTSNPTNNKEHSAKDYEYVLTPPPGVEFMAHQRPAIDYAFKWLWTKANPDGREHNGLVMVMPTGSGKTFTVAQLCHLINKHNIIDGKTISPFPILWLTKAPVVVQTARVCEQRFKLHVPNNVFVTSFDGLRNSTGKRMLKDENIVVEGEIRRKFTWYPAIHPYFVIADECQALKNDSTQSAIVQAFSHLDRHGQFPVKFLAMSATPWCSVSEAKSVVVNLNLPMSSVYESRREEELNREAIDV